MKTLTTTNAKELFINYLENEQGYSPYTVKLYSKAIDDFYLFLNKKYITSVTEKNLLNFRKKVEIKNESYKTKNLRLIPVRMFLAFLKMRGVNVQEYRILSSFRNRNGNKKINLPDEEDINKFIGGCSDPQVDLLIKLIYSTGLRISEVLRLKIGEVEETFNIIGKGSKERFIICNIDVVKDVRDYEKKNEIKSDLLFTFSTRTAQRLIEKKAKEFGLKISAHTLRHCYATRLLKKGMDIRSVQELLGHSSIVTTQRYTHVTNNDLLEKYRKINLST